MTAIVATPDTTNGRMVLTITNTSGGTVYVFRRTVDGVGVVRDAQEGLTGASITSYDYEAVQGTPNTDYVVTDPDGASLATVRVTVPLWGSWLKAPARPWLNVKVHPEKPGSETYPAQRNVLEVEGSDTPVVLYQSRQAAKGDGLGLACLTTAESDGILALLADGATVLLDVTDAWNFPFRYVNVGDVTVERVWDDGLGLDNVKRIVRLGGLVKTSVPLIPVDTVNGAVYSDIPIDFPTYNSIPALVASYTALVTAA